jgi:hypothetical protein
VTKIHWRLLYRKLNLLNILPQNKGTMNLQWQPSCTYLSFKISYHLIIQFYISTRKLERYSQDYSPCTIPYVCILASVSSVGTKAVLTS